MAKFLTEYEVQDACKVFLGLDRAEQNVKQDAGQLTTFNKLDVKNDNNKPGGNQECGDGIAGYVNNIFATGGRATSSV